MVRKIVKWLIIAAVALVVLTVGAIMLFPSMLDGPTAPPLELPPLDTAAASDSAAALDGTWTVTSGSIVGFRVEESILTQHSTVVGRTSAVSGSLVIENNAITSGDFQADLSQLLMGEKPNEGFFKMMNTAEYPNAELTFTSPIAFTVPADGQTVSASVEGSLTLHGSTHPVTFSFSGRTNGTMLEAVGTAPVLASDWGIESPFGIANDVVIEFLVILQRQ